MFSPPVCVATLSSMVPQPSPWRQSKEEPRRACRSGKLSMVSPELHSYDHMPLLVSFFDISVCIDYLFQRISFVYDRSDLPSFNKLFEE